MELTVKRLKIGKTLVPKCKCGGFPELYKVTEPCSGDFWLIRCGSCGIFTGESPSKVWCLNNWIRIQESK